MDAVQRRSYVELVLLSVVSLYLELLIIRWLAQDFRVFCVFKTFPLVTCFVGLGVGFALGKDKVFKSVPAALLAFLAIARSADYLGFSMLIFPSVAFFQWRQLQQFNNITGFAYIAIVMVMLVLILGGAFWLMMAIGSRLGVLFNQFKPLEAYSANILGSILGSILFTIISFLGWAPFWQLIPAAVALALVLPKDQAKMQTYAGILVLAIAVAVSAWQPQPKDETSPTNTTTAQAYWSPYQRLDVSELPPLVDNQGKPLPDITGYHIGANRYGYQNALNLMPATVHDAEGKPGLIPKLMVEGAHHYNVPYFLKPHPQDVLILGAGSGNDVASALRAGAEHIDAVDIDPVIMDLGVRLHPEKPYSSAKVTRICDDARHFLRQSNKKYDLINFAGLDSFTIVGQGGSVTLCNYVYTTESIKEALQLLKPDGLLVLTFYKCNDWLSKRLYLTLEEAAGYPPLVTSDHGSPSWRWEVYLTGPQVKEHELTSLPAAAAPFGLDPAPPGPNQRVMTDDWPFIFITPAVIDWPYLLVVAEILILSLFAGRKLLFSPTEPRSWQLFFMGAAFMLLELQSVARLSLLFGATWLTSAVVIVGILIAIYFANLIIIKTGPNLNQVYLYVLLFASVVCSYLLPVNQILVWGVPFGNIGYLIVTAVTIMAIAFAALIFSCSFARTSDPAKTLAFNLFGAVVGAMLEVLSTQLGINAMALVAGVLYLGSFACYMAAERSKGKQLATPDAAK